MDVKFKEWELSPPMASVTNPAILLQEASEPVGVYILAFEADDNSKNFSVVEFFYEDSGLFKLHQAHIDPYIKRLAPGKIYFCENSPAGNGYDRDHWLAVFDQSMYEIVGSHVAVHTVVAESSTDAIVKFINSPRNNIVPDTHEPSVNRDGNKIINIIVLIISLFYIVNLFNDKPKSSKFIYHPKQEYSLYIRDCGDQTEIQKDTLDDLIAFTKNNQDKLVLGFLVGNDDNIINEFIPLKNASESPTFLFIPNVKHQFEVVEYIIKNKKIVLGQFMNKLNEKAYPSEIDKIFASTPYVSYLYISNLTEPFEVKSYTIHHQTKEVAERKIILH